MKLSFSTRGWGDLPWEDLLNTALDMGFSGVEVYNLQNFPELQDRSGPFHKYHTAATVRDLREKKLSIPCFDTSLDLSDGETAIEPMTRLFEIARDMRVNYVVAFAYSDAEEQVIANLEELLPIAEEKQVTILLKTSGIYADTTRLRKLLDSFASDYLAALWDMHHPYRDFGESADTTIKNLGAYVRHVHLRDSNDRDTYNLIGEGSRLSAAMR